MVPVYETLYALSDNPHCVFSDNNRDDCWLKQAGSRMPDFPARRWDIQGDRVEEYPGRADPAGGTLSFLDDQLIAGSQRIVVEFVPVANILGRGLKFSGDGRQGVTIFYNIPGGRALFFFVNKCNGLLG